IADHAATVAGGLLRALTKYADDRLPELFAGYPADRFETPVEYPNPNRPQAWASGAVILLVRAILGLDVNALEKRVWLRPVPVPGVNQLRIQGVPIAGSKATITLAVKDGAPKAEITGIPDGWKVES